MKTAGRTHPEQLITLKESPRFMAFYSCLFLWQKRGLLRPPTFSVFVHLGLGCDRLRGRKYSLTNVDAIRRLKSIPLIGIIIFHTLNHLL